MIYLSMFSEVYLGQARGGSERARGSEKPFHEEGEVKLGFQRRTLMVRSQIFSISAKES